MAEFDPTPPKDVDEAAYAAALLGDDTGREQRHARLMAALPRPEAAAAVPVSDSSLAWRWQPYAWGLAAGVLLLATVLLLKGRPAEPTKTLDPRLAAGPAASAPVVVAQAEPPREAAPQAPAAVAPPVAAKIIPSRPPAMQLPPPMVVADASMPQQRKEAEAAVTVAAESARQAVEPPPAAPVMAAAPPPVMAPKPVVPPAAAVTAAAPVAPSSNQAEALARADSAAGLASARARMSLAASEPVKLMTPAESFLLAAVNHADLATARSALQSGASAHLRDDQGRTVLMLAARTGSREMVELLLAAGARKADRDPQGLTAADHARSVGQLELAEQLR
ncbi:ankyrin repeat domain-containing protein [Roseateles sp. NT4]|uniref:ankyrin repeat domain-containing protein n=1 Tax=Roseateles sp. NT4 TaxID=3453715 RepID=UPI003EEE6664